MELRAPDASREAARMAVPKLQSFGRPGWKDGNRLSSPRPPQIWQLACQTARPNLNRGGQKQELPFNIFETIFVLGPERAHTWAGLGDGGSVLEPADILAAAGQCEFVY